MNAKRKRIHRAFVRKTMILFAVAMVKPTGMLARLPARGLKRMLRVCATRSDANDLAQQQPHPKQHSDHHGNSAGNGGVPPGCEIIATNAGKNSDESCENQ